MCRTCFIVVLEYLIKHKSEKNEILICSYNLEEMIEIAKIYNFKVKLIDIDLKTGVMDSKMIENNISKRHQQYYIQTCLTITQNCTN